MIDIIETLNHQGVPTDSFIAAAAFCNQSTYNKDKYEQYLSVLTDSIKEFDDITVARLTWGYFAQQYVKQINQAPHPPEEINQLYDNALASATSLMTNNRWMFAVAEDRRDDGSVIEHKKKGWKQIRSIEIFKENPSASKKEIIALFVSELDMTPSGAQTYYYNIIRELKETV